MATNQVLDKQGLRHYATKMCNAENRKVGSKSLPIALNDIDTAIDGFKTLFDNEYGSPIITNIESDTNPFFIGTGNGIDKNNEIENSFTNVTITGVSLWNMYNNDFQCYDNISSAEININNDIISINGSESQFKNFFRNDIDKYKPNTDYTVIVETIERNNVNEEAVLNLINNDTDDSIFLDWYCMSIKDLRPINKRKIRTLSSFDGKIHSLRSYVNNMTQGALKIRISVLEGDWTNKTLPRFFDGIQSVGENANKLTLISNNKNLFDVKFNRGKSFEGGSLVKETNSEIIYKTTDKKYNQMYYWIKVTPGIEYILSAELSNMQVHAFNGEISWWDSSKYIGGMPPNGIRTMKINPTTDTISIRVTNEQAIGDNICKNLMFCKTVDNNKYVEHKEVCQDITLKQPLLGIPNGIKDTIEKINGKWKIVKRCGQITLNGTEDWVSRNMANQTKTIGFGLFGTNIPNYKDGLGLNDRFIMNEDPNKTWNTDMECCTNIDFVHFRILKSKLTRTDEQGFKEWLSQHPVKLIYELDNPIIEDIDSADIQCWKNGSIYIQNAVIPALTTHTVALNKTAQIQNNIEELTSLRNRVQKLEEQYDSTILTQAYQTILLNFDNNL